jgi:allophanate hydrolase
VAAIIGAGREVPAHRLATDGQRLRHLRRRVARVLRDIDAVAVPTAPHLPHVSDVVADPVGVNNRLGRFTAPVNLLDLCALAVPAGTTADGLPFGVSLHGPAFADAALAELGARFLEEADPRAGASRDATRLRRGIPLIVAGAHLVGQPLNHQLTDRGARLVETTTTASCYRLYALDTEPPKPGLVRAPGGGAAIEVERWELAPEAFAEFVALVPPPLAIGAVQLADGSWHPGFTCMPHGLEGAADITATGGWRVHLGAARSA